MEKKDRRATISKGKKAKLIYQVIVQIILIVLIFGLFFIASLNQVNSRGVRQQVVEKQTALLIDSAKPGMSFVISKTNVNGLVRLEIKSARVFAYIDGQGFSKGYPYFSK